MEAIRTLRLVRSSARKERTRALNQMRSLVSTAPDEVRDQLRGLSIYRLLERAGSYRPTDRRSVVGATKLSLRMLARRVRSLDAEIAELDAELQPLVAATAPELVAQIGVGTDSAARCSSPRATTRSGCDQRRRSRICAARHRWTHRQANSNDIASTPAATGKLTPRCGAS